MPTLVIVESPGKTRKINQILGPGYLVRASFGHIRDLPTSARPARPGERAATPLGLDIERGWVPEWEVVDGKERVASELRRAGSSGPVYLATDLDREGEAIAWHLRDLLGGDESRFRRVTFAEITPEAVRAAFEQPRGIDYDLVRAQQARRFLDRVVGFEVSPLLSRRLRARLSAGRVQSAALRLLVDRDEQIRVFVSREFYGVDLHLSVEAGGGTATVIATVVDAEGNVRRFDDRADADAVAAALARVPVDLVDVQQVDKHQKPRPPFTTSTLQQAASSLLKLSVSDTMATAQRLYEAGRITYMRSDAVFVAKAAQTAARGWLEAAFGPDAVPASPPSYSSKAGAQEAHEAIRPTDVRVGPDRVDGSPDQALYDLIRRRLIASQMKPARVRRTTWKLAADAGGESIPLVAKGRVVLDPGFHLVLPPASAVDEPPTVPDLEPGAQWPAGAARAEVTTSWTKPPQRFTEASLVAHLESVGVGRPSTYANILKVLLDRAYVLLDGRVFVVTPLGRLVSSRLTRHFPQVTDIGFTATLEESLDKVAAGDFDYRALLDGFHSTLSQDLAGADAARDFAAPDPALLSGQCPACSRQPVLRYDGGVLRVVCPGCRSMSELAWAPRKARRRAAKPESSEKAAAEQAAADQRLQSRCPACGGAQQRWALSAGGHVHLCQAWPACSGATLEPGTPKAARPGARKSAAGSSSRGPKRKSARRSRS